MKALQKFNTRFAAPLVALLMLAGCMQDATKSAEQVAAEKAQVENEQAIIDNIADNVIVATYRDIVARTTEMATLARNLQKNPTAENLLAIQNKWREARIPWESSESFVFGPGVETDPTVDSWPLSITDLHTLLVREPNISLDRVRRLPDGLKGFHTAEYLIFGDGVKDNQKSIQEMTAGEMTYLISVTTVLQESFQTLYNRWTVTHDASNATAPAYVTMLKNPGKSISSFNSTKAVLAQIVAAMAKIATEVGSTKIDTPLGGDIGSADPSQVESQFSWNSLADFGNNVQSLRNVYTGDYNGHEGPGLDVIVKAKNSALDARFHAQLDKAEAAIRNIAGPEGLSYTLAIQNPAARNRARVAITEMKTLEDMIINELTPALR